MEASRSPPLVDEPERAGFSLEEPGQLRWGAAERGRCGSRVVAVRVEEVERLGEDGGEVAVLGRDGDPPPSASRLPERARVLVESGRAADLERQVEAEAPERGAEVLGLAPPLARLGHDPGRTMGQDDRRLDLVAVLATGPRPTGPPGRSRSASARRSRSGSWRPT